MITFFEANLVKLAVHHVGNPVMDEGLSISEQETDLSDELKRQLLTNYFLLPFQKTVQIFNFHHPSGNRDLNHVHSLANYLFTGEFSFLETSEGLARALYSASNHPKIKAGELYIALFDNVQIEGELLPAIGIFKSEAKETYLKVNPSATAFEVGYEREAVNINHLDKGCLIFNSFHAENGYKVAVIDNSSKADHSYWTDDFLQLEVRNDNFNQTGNLLNIYKHFVTEKLDDEFEVSKSDKIDLLNRGIKYFEEKEAFDLEEFNEEVIVGIAAAESFTNFKQQFQEDFETPIADTFEISDTAVKKQARAFKKVLKLDKNFQLHISGNKSLIERGYDQEKALNYYKVYFKEESL